VEDVVLKVVEMGQDAWDCLMRQCSPSAEFGVVTLVELHCRPNVEEWIKDQWFYTLRASPGLLKTWPFVCNRLANVHLDKVWELWHDVQFSSQNKSILPPCKAYLDNLSQRSLCLLLKSVNDASLQQLVQAASDMQRVYMLGHVNCFERGQVLRRHLLDLGVNSSSAAATEPIESPTLPVVSENGQLRIMHMSKFRNDTLQTDEIDVLLSFLPHLDLEGIELVRTVCGHTQQLLPPQDIYTLFHRVWITPSEKCDAWRTKLASVAHHSSLVSLFTPYTFATHPKSSRILKFDTVQVLKYAETRIPSQAHHHLCALLLYIAEPTPQPLLSSMFKSKLLWTHLQALVVSSISESNAILFQSLAEVMFRYLAVFASGDLWCNEPLRSASPSTIHTVTQDIIKPTSGKSTWFVWADAAQFLKTLLTQTWVHCFKQIRPWQIYTPGGLLLMAHPLVCLTDLLVNKGLQVDPVDTLSWVLIDFVNLLQHVVNRTHMAEHGCHEVFLSIAHPLTDEPVQPRPDLPPFTNWLTQIIAAFSVSPMQLQEHKNRRFHLPSTPTALTLCAAMEQLSEKCRSEFFSRLLVIVMLQFALHTTEGRSTVATLGDALRNVQSSVVQLSLRAEDTSSSRSLLHAQVLLAACITQREEPEFRVMVNPCIMLLAGMLEMPQLLRLQVLGSNSFIMQRIKRDLARPWPQRRGVAQNCVLWVTRMFEELEKPLLQQSDIQACKSAIIEHGLIVDFVMYGLPIPNLKDAARADVEEQWTRSVTALEGLEVIARLDPMLLQPVIGASTTNLAKLLGRWLQNPITMPCMTKNPELLDAVVFITLKLIEFPAFQRDCEKAPLVLLIAKAANSFPPDALRQWEWHLDSLAQIIDKCLVEAPQTFERWKRWNLGDRLAAYMAKLQSFAPADKLAPWEARIMTLQ